MTKTQEYLQEKNMYLEKFLGLNREWIDRLERSDFGGLEDYREDREKILNIIKHIDTLIEEHSLSLDLDDVNENQKDQVVRLLDRKDSLVKAILGQDLDIMQIIDSAKVLILKELKRVGKHRSYRAHYRKDLIDEEV